MTRHDRCAVQQQRGAAVSKRAAGLTELIFLASALYPYAQASIQDRQMEVEMAERVSGPYRGYYISAAARLVNTNEAASSRGKGGKGGKGGESAGGIYVGSVSLSQRGPDDVHRIETLLELGDEQRFATEEAALEHVERAARAYIDRLLQVSSS